MNINNGRSWISRSLLAFIEDPYKDVLITELPIDIVSTTTQSPSSPPPLRPICEYVCYNLNNCKEVIAFFTQNDIKERYRHIFYSKSTLGEDMCKSDEPWKCLNNPMHYYSNCLSLRGCPPGTMVSGFGRTLLKQERCIPIMQCEYLSKIYRHVNDVHDDISWN